MKGKIASGLLVVCMIFTFAFVANAFSPYRGIVNEDEVKLYASPSKDDRIIEVLRNGDVIKVLGKSEDAAFWEIEHKGKHGWVIFKFIDRKL